MRKSKVQPVKKRAAVKDKMTCLEAQTLIIPFLENNLEFSRKYELVKHIRSCNKCREELEFYFVVYITIGKIDDRKMSSDYAAEVETLLERVEYRKKRERRMARVRKARLVTILIAIGMFFSFGVGKIIPEEEQPPLSAIRPSFYLGQMQLPEEISFVQNTIRELDQQAGDFTISQQRREVIRQALWSRDFFVTVALKENGRIRYELPKYFFEVHGSFEEQLFGKTGTEQRTAEITLLPQNRK